MINWKSSTKICSRIIINCLSILLLRRTCGTKRAATDCGAAFKKMGIIFPTLRHSVMILDSVKKKKNRFLAQDWLGNLLRLFQRLLLHRGQKNKTATSGNLLAFQI